MIKFSMLLLLAVPAAVLAHSWISCTKYDGDLFADGGYQPGKCRGYVRNWEPDNNGRQFGFDNLQVNTFDFRGGRNPNQAVCKGFKGQGYPSQFPAATYRQGERVRLVWPAKNHGGPGNGGCVDNHADTADWVFAYCGDQRDPTFRELDFGRSPNRIADLKANGRGFKNCVNFCRDTDKAACQGDFVVPNHLSGRCTFVWLWEMNQGEFYTSCWEADVLSAGASVPNPPPTNAPAAPITPGPQGNGRFIRLARSPNPIPANGGFDVEVQWALPGQRGLKTVVLDILRSNFQYMGKGFQLEDRESNTNRFHVSSDFGNQFGEGEEALLKMYVVRREIWDRDPSNAWRQVEVEAIARVRASFGGRRTLDIEEVSVPQGLTSFGIVGASVAGVLLVAVVAVAVVAGVRARKAKNSDNTAHIQMVDEHSAAI